MTKNIGTMNNFDGREPKEAAIIAAIDLTYWGLIVLLFVWAFGRVVRDWYR